MRLLLLYVFLFYSCGIIIYHTSNMYFTGAVLTALFLILMLKKQRYLVLFCIAFMLLGVFTAHIHLMNFEKKYSELSSMDTYEGYVLDKQDNRYIVKNYDKGYKIGLSLYNKADIVPGDYIYFEGKISELSRYKRKRMYSSGFNGYITSSTGNIRIEKKTNLLLIPAKAKYKINSGLISVSKEGGGFISGLISGETYNISQENVNIFSELGISHVLAVSGFNLGVIYFFISMLTKKVSKKTRCVIVFIVCLIYTALGGFEPSITRAFIMIGISIFATIVMRTYNALNGIILAALIMLLYNSYYLLNIGFILSFAATSGIVFLKQDIEDNMPQKIKWMREEIAVSLSAFIATLPVILWYKGTFSLFSILVNIIISPVISIITIVGFASGFVYALIGIKEILYPGVFLGEMFLRGIKYIYPVNMPLDMGRPPIYFIVFYYLSMMVLFGYIKIKIFKKKKHVKTILILITIALLFYRVPGLKVHFIDVGQGDSILIQTPKNRNILIDTGPQYKDYMAVREKVIPYLKLNGCNRIDMLIITHFHSDHAGGIEYLLKNFKVSKVLSFSKPENFPYDVEYIMDDDSIKVDDVKLEVLFPKGNTDEENKEDINETCLVMELKYRDFSMLFTADAVKEVMDKVNGEYDVYKVPHHGSIHSLSTDMLNRSKIGTAIISVGKNSFGHPSPTVIDELEKRNINVYRTDLDSNITILTDGISYRVLSQAP